VGIAAALIGSAVIGGGASLIAGKSQAKAAKAAGSESAAATKYATDIQYKMFQEAKQLQEPFRLLGLDPARALSQEVTLGEESPIYRFRKRALDRALAARGLSQSGQGVIEESGLAAEEATRIENIQRFLAGLGQASAAGTASGAITTGGGMASTFIRGGEAQANARLARGQAQASAITGIANAASGGVGSYIFGKATGIF